MLKGKTVLLGVTGGIAVYKSADLVSRLKKQGANVEVVMTKGATEFITPLTFQTMSNNVVHEEMFKEIIGYDVEHISLAQKADIVVIAPATANTIAKIRMGIADNLLTTVVLATKAKVLIAPAMNTAMYENPITQDNMEYLKKLGYEFISPGAGLLACGDVGAGRMAEPVEILEYIIDHFRDKDLDGVKVTVTAAGTIEPIDPVRYIGNRSSGKMGYEIAQNARDRGADVTLISGPSHLKAPKGVKLEKVETTREMMDVLGKYFDNTDVLIKAAAPSDYRPIKTLDKKIKKSEDNKEMTIEVTENPDIVAYYGNRKKNQIIVGFAAETNDLEKYAKKKLESKNLDFIVANDVTKKGAGFNVDTNIVTIIDRDDNVYDYPMKTKAEIARIILDRVKSILDDKTIE